MNFKDFAIYGLVVAVLAIAGYFMVNAFNYFDPLNLCYVDVDRDILRGNRATIREAIKKVKRDSEDDYGTICKYVNKISENYCIASDWHLNPSWHDDMQDKSCYIRGSKTIYLFPVENYSQDVVFGRAEAIKKYSNYSKEFWELNK